MEAVTWVIEVDPKDLPLGLVEKKEAHSKGILHRAFSVFIFRRTGSFLQLLLQQRAFSKYHSGGLWTNTCCSHAEPGVSIDVTAENRLREEMGFSCPLHFLGSFYYKEDVGNAMVEHEIDYVFAALYDPPSIRLNPEEAFDFEWVEISTLQKRLLEEPARFTAWFSQALEIALRFSLCQGAHSHL